MNDINLIVLSVIHSKNNQKLQCIINAVSKRNPQEFTKSDIQKSLQFLRRRGLVETGFGNGWSYTL